MCAFEYRQHRVAQCSATQFSRAEIRFSFLLSVQHNILSHGADSMYSQSFFYLRRFRLSQYFPLNANNAAEIYVSF